MCRILPFFFLTGLNLWMVEHANWHLSLHLEWMLKLILSLTDWLITAFLSLIYSPELVEHVKLLCWVLYGSSGCFWLTAKVYKGEWDTCKSFRKWYSHRSVVGNESCLQAGISPLKLEELFFLRIYKTLVLGLGGSLFFGCCLLSYLLMHGVSPPTPQYLKIGRHRGPFQSDTTSGCWKIGLYAVV